MATYKILYWQEVPTQIRVEDDSSDLDVRLSPRFMERVDILAAQRGLQGADEFLAQWKWSEEEDRDGTAEEVADALQAELEAKWPPV